MEMPRCFLLFGSTYRGVVKIQRMSVDNKALTRPYRDRAAFLLRICSAPPQVNPVSFARESLTQPRREEWNRRLTRAKIFSFLIAKRKPHSVKKHRPRIKKAAAKSKPQANTPPPMQRLSEPPLPRHRRLWRASKWFLGVAAAVIGLVASVAGLWGPIWPTEPIFSSAFPSSGLPLEVPFAVANKSVIFPIRDLNIRCGLISVRTAKNNAVGKIAVAGFGGNILNPRESRTFTCAFHQVFLLSPDDNLISAQVQFISEYKSRLPWKKTTQSESDVFSLNTRTIPPQWTVGTPLQ
jgi:hypothetical protein